MKELSKFYEQNKNQINVVEESAQSAHKGGRLSLTGGIFKFSFPLLRSVSRTNKLTKPKIFTSFSEFRSYTMGGK